MTLGVHDISNDDEVTRVSMKISEVITHPLFNYITKYYDVSLTKLEKKIDFMKYIRPVCLPEDTSKNYAERDATITGWGLIG